MKAVDAHGDRPATIRLCGRWRKNSRRCLCPPPEKQSRQALDEFWADFEKEFVRSCGQRTRQTPQMLRCADFFEPS